MNGLIRSNTMEGGDVRILRWALTSELAETARRRLQALDQRIRRTPVDALDGRWNRFLEDLDDLIGRIPPAE